MSPRRHSLSWLIGSFSLLVLLISLGFGHLDKPSSSWWIPWRITLEQNLNNAYRATHHSIAHELRALLEWGTFKDHLPETFEAFLTAHIGDSYFIAGEYQQALAFQEKATSLAEYHYGADSQQVAVRLAEEVLTLYFLSEYDLGIPLAERSLALSLKHWGPNSLETASRQGDLALLYSYSDRNAEAEMLSAEALKTRIQLQGLKEEDTIEQIRQHAEVQRHRPLGSERGIQLNEIALALSEAFVGWHSIRTETILNDIEFYLRQDYQCEKALPYSKEALSMALLLEDPLGSEVANRYHSLGTTLYCLSDLQGAIQMTEEALKISRLRFGENHVNVAYLEAELADWYAQIEDLESSRSLATKALSTLDETLGDLHPNAPDILDFVGTAAMNWDVDLSMSLSERYLKTMRALYGEHDIALVDPLINLSQGLMLKGDGKKALKLATQASQLTLGYASSHHTLPEEEALEARVLAELMEGHDQKAEQHALEALAFSEQKLGVHHPGNAVNYHLLAKSIRVRNPELAITFEKRAVALHLAPLRNLSKLGEKTAQRYRHSLLPEMGLLSEWLKEDHRNPEARFIDEFTQSPAPMTPVGDSLEAFPLLTESETTWLNQYDEIAQRRRRMDLPMRTLQRHADSGIVTSKDLALAHSLEMRGRQNMKAFEALYRTPERMQRTDDEIPKVLPLENIRRRLLKETSPTAWIHHELSARELKITVVTSSMTRVVRIKVRANDWMRRIKEGLLQLKQPDKAVHAARQLHQWLLEPVMNTFQEQHIDTLFFDADSSITGIPFAALHDGMNYLVETYATSYLHGASEEPPRIHWPAQVLALGNGRPHGVMRGLPWVEEELTSITTPDRQGIWSGSVLANHRFDRTHLQEMLHGSFNILHMATHFLYSPGHEEASGILLGDGSYLFQNDWIALLKKRPPLDLVTLSACETGGGDPSKRGNQNLPAGLIDALMNLGTKQVIGTLWPIDDHDAYDLMRRFYDQVKHQQSSPSKALQSAQKAWGDKHSTARWASLVLHHH